MVLVGCGVIAVAATALGQQQGEQLYEPPECAIARDAAAAGHTQQAAEWQRLCVAKKQADQSTTSPDSGAMSKALQRDLDDATRAHVDLSVFGIRLGERLQLPPCADETSEFCVSVHDANMLSFVNQLADAGRLSLPGIATGAPVKLPRSKCPGWLFDCAVYLDIRHGIPVGATVYTAGRTDDDVDAVETALNEKYGSSHGVPGKKVSTCQNTLTGVVTSQAKERMWQRPGLSVMYSPIANCQLRQGVLIVKFTHVSGEVEKKRRASEPKM